MSASVTETVKAELKTYNDVVQGGRTPGFITETQLYKERTEKRMSWFLDSVKIKVRNWLVVLGKRSIF